MREAGLRAALPPSTRREALQRRVGPEAAGSPAPPAVSAGREEALAAVCSPCHLTPQGLEPPSAPPRSWAHQPTLLSEEPSFAGTPKPS